MLSTRESVDLIVRDFFLSSVFLLLVNERQEARQKRGDMSAQTVLLDLAIDSSRISDAVGQKDVIKLLEKGLLEFFPQLKLIFETSTSDGYLCVFTQTDTIYLHVRFFNHGIVTINIEFFKDDAEQSVFSFDVSTKQHNLFIAPIHTAGNFTFSIVFFPLRAKDTDSHSQ